MNKKRSKVAEFERKIRTKLIRRTAAIQVSLLLISMAVPLGAAEDQFTLDIFGNANMDDTIDEDDIKYVQGIINGENETTELADANYDGKVDENDIAQIELIIRGEEKNLTIMQYIQLQTATTFSQEPVTVPMPVDSIAALGGSYGPEMLCVFGIADKIAAVTEYSKTRGEFVDLIKDIPVAASSEWDMEKIISLKPDVVLAYAIYDYSAERQILEKEGITLVQMNFHKPETYSREVRNLGWLLDKKERAEELIEFEEDHLNFIRDRVSGLDEVQKPRVYAEGKDWSYTSGSSVSRAIEFCGGDNLFKELAGTVDLDPEEVIVRDPQVIIKGTSTTAIPESGYNAMNDSQMAAAVETIMNRSGMEVIDAVKNGRVYIISTDAASIHPSVFNSYVAKWLYPELFQDLDPVSVHKEWLNEFLGVEFKGVYAYPLL